MIARACMPSLEAWLVSATRGLCVESQARIREEVEAHYLETLRDEIAKDGDAFEAVLTADRSLGNARVARRQFRRRHLTIHEALMVECFTCDATGARLFQWKGSIFSAYGLFTIFLLAVSLSRSNPNAGQSAFILVIVPLYILTTIALWNPPRRLSLAEKFQWRGRVAAAEVCVLVVAFLPLGGLVMLGGIEESDRIAARLFLEYGYRLWFGFLAAFHVWDAWSNLNIARKVRGHHQTPEAT